MRISYWIADVCSSDLSLSHPVADIDGHALGRGVELLLLQKNAAVGVAVVELLGLERVQGDRSDIELQAVSKHEARQRERQPRPGEGELREEDTHGGKRSGRKGRYGGEASSEKK